MESFSKTSAGRKTVPIRRLLLPIMATLLFMMIGFLTVGLNMSGRIQTFAHELEEQTLKDVVHAQRNSINLHYLSKSLQDLVYAGNPQRARTAYVNNWGLLTETVFGQHDEAKPLTQRLTDSLQKTWSLRQEYEARRNEVNVDFNAFHQDLLAAAGVAAGLSNASTNLLIDLRQPIVQHLDRPAPHRRHLEVLESAARELCTAAHRPSDDERRTAFLSYCKNMRELPRTLGTKLDALDAARTEFLAQADAMNEDAQNLSHVYAKLEASNRLGLIDQITRFNNHLFSSFSVAVFLAMAMATAIALAAFWVLRPLGELREEMRRFLETNKLPKMPKGSRIEEINDVVEWLMHFCEMLHQKRASLSLLTSQYDELLNESNKDPLTGLANRRAFEALVEKADNLPANSAALMIDIDYFKRVNDTRGHLFGDQILKRFGEQIRGCIAQNDVVYRYGGEEFCLLLTGVTAKIAYSMAERIRLRMRRISLADASVSETGEAPSPLSVSIGISTSTKHWAEKDILTLVREADLALYRAKCLGRNLTVRYEPEEVRKSSPFADRMEGSHA